MSKISHDVIIKFAIDSGCYREDCGFTECDFEAITRFAGLVAAQERQACAKICEEESYEWLFADAGYQGVRNCMEKIILRGKK